MKRPSPLTTLDVSAHRSAIYGFAALAILYHHLISKVPSGAIFAPLRWMKHNFVAGLEIFFLLAALGAYASLEKRPDIKGFYLRRLRRVALPAFIVSFIAFGLAGYGFWDFLSAITFFPYWLGGAALWFVPVILTLYLIYPLIYRLQKRRPKAMWGLLAAAFALSFCACRDFPRGIDHFLLPAMRAPIFIIGCMLAPWAHRGGRIPRWAAPALLAGYTAIALLPGGTSDSFLRSVSYIFLAPLMIIAVTRLSALIAGGRIYRFLAFCGGISLEIYMIYTRLLYFMVKLPFYSGGRWATLGLEAVTAALTLGLSVLVQRLCAQIEAFIRRRLPR